MAGRIGRKVAFEWDGNEIDGVREKSANCNGEPVDVTSDESDGWRTLLDEAGENTVEISLSGIIKSDALREAWFSGNRTEVASLGYPDGGELSGPFFLAAYNETEPYKDAATFEATLQSAGLVEYTAAATPVNSVLPSIAGIPQVGVTLTAYPGVWSGHPSFTYQWKNEGTPISGETGKTYVPVVGDVGDTITVTVTATNSAGNANATSAGAIDVIAA